MFWNEYGMGSTNPHSDLSMRDYQAHLAIIQGRQKKKAEDQREAEKNSPD